MDAVYILLLQKSQREGILTYLCVHVCLHECVALHLSYWDPEYTSGNRCTLILRLLSPND